MNTFWELRGFEESLERWISIENPPIGVRLAVASWILGVADDAYAQARRDPSVAPNYWTVQVPNSEFEGTAVLCCYWIDEDTRTVSCDTIATLSLPF